MEPKNCRSFEAALKHGKPVTAEVKGTLADGLAVPMVSLVWCIMDRWTDATKPHHPTLHRPIPLTTIHPPHHAPQTPTQVGPTAFEVARRFTDDVVYVDEKMIALAMLRLLENERCVVEGGGATGLAALLPGGPLDLPEYKNKNVVVLLCGGNIDITMLGRVIDRGLAADGRLIRFIATGASFWRGVGWWMGGVGRLMTESDPSYHLNSIPQSTPSHPFHPHSERPPRRHRHADEAHRGGGRLHQGHHPRALLALPQRRQGKHSKQKAVVCVSANALID